MNQQNPNQQTISLEEAIANLTPEVAFQTMKGILRNVVGTADETDYLKAVYTLIEKEMGLNESVTPVDSRSDVEYQPVPTNG